MNQTPAADYQSWTRSSLQNRPEGPSTSPIASITGVLAPISG
jgi:hypothetical protein